MNTIRTSFIYVISLKILSAIFAVIFPLIGLLGYSLSYWILGFAIPLCLMIWYIIEGAKSVKTLSIDNQIIFGNSCYYLGFLFTIATLIISLFMLGAVEFDVGSISLQFATAMITTLIGMCVRIYYVTFSKYDSYKNGGTIKTANGETLVIPPIKQPRNDADDNSLSGLASLQQSLAEIPVLGKILSRILSYLPNSNTITIDKSISVSDIQLNTHLETTYNRFNPSITEPLSEESNNNLPHNENDQIAPRNENNAVDSNGNSIEESAESDDSNGIDNNGQNSSTENGKTDDSVPSETNKIPPIHIEESPKTDDSLKNSEPSEISHPRPINLKPVEADPDEGIEVVIEAYCHNIAAMNSELINSINLYNQTNNVMMYTFGRLRSDLMNEIKDDREFKNAVKNFTKRVIEQHSAQSTQHLTNVLRLNHKESEKYIEEVKKRIDQIESQSVERYKDLNKEFSNNCEHISEKMLGHFETSASNFLEKLQNITEKHVDAYIDFQNKTNDSLEHVVKTQLELEKKMAEFNATQVKACEKTVRESIKRISAVGNECQQELSVQLNQITSNADSYVSNFSNVIDDLISNIHSASDIENLHNTVNEVVTEIKEGAYSVQQIFKEFANELDASMNESKISESLQEASVSITSSLNEYSSTVSDSIKTLNSQLKESTALYKKRLADIDELENHVEEKISSYNSLLDKKIELLSDNVEQTELIQKQQLDSFNSLTEELKSNISNYKSAMESGVNYFDNSLTTAQNIHEKQIEISQVLSELKDNLEKNLNGVQDLLENQLNSMRIKQEPEMISNSEEQTQTENSSVTENNEQIDNFDK